MTTQPKSGRCMAERAVASATATARATVRATTRATAALRAATRLAPLAMAAALSACGGGASTEATSATVASPLAITTANADTTARAGLTALRAGQSTAGFGDGLTQGGVATQTVVAQSTRLRALAARAMADRRVSALAGDSRACADGGTMSVLVTNVNGNDLFDAASESIVINVSNCKENGVMMNGRYEVYLAAYSDASNASFRMTFDSFAYQDLATGVIDSLDGQVTIAVTNGAQFSVRSTVLYLATESQGVRHAHTVQSLAAEVALAANATTETVSGVFSGTDLGGQSLTVSTTTPFVQGADQLYPAQGSLMIRGAGTSSLKLDALSTTQARLSVDADGDGVYESISVRNWTELI